MSEYCKRCGKPLSGHELMRQRMGVDPACMSCYMGRHTVFCMADFDRIFGRNDPRREAVDRLFAMGDVESITIKELNREPIVFPF